MLPEIFGAAAVILLVYIALVFNSLVAARNRVRNSWAQIDVQLKKRADLVCNLVEIVKGYAKHEKTLFEKVAKERAAIAASTDREQTLKESNILSGAMKSVLAVAENYPNLKANENFLKLQKQLVKIEDDIARARMVYNDVVTIYNTAINSFPKNVLAPPLGFGEEKLLQTSDIKRAAVKVEV